MGFNQNVAEIFQRKFEENGKHPPKNWVWVCVRYLNFYFGNKKDIVMTAEDIVMEIIMQTITEERKWDIENKTIDQHIYNCIRSKVTHLYEKQKRVVENEIYNEVLGKTVSITNETAEYSKEEIEAELDRKDLIKRCFEKIEDDTEMGLVFELLAEGKTPLDIEKEYGISTQEIDAIRKRIYRSLRKEFAGEIG